MKARLTRRQFVATSAAIIAAGSTSFSARAQGRQVVLATYGGTFLQSLRKAYLDPFEKETGIKVVVAGEPSAAKVKAMVESGNTEWDVAQHTTSEMLGLQNANLLEKIDYSGFAKAELDQMVPEVVKPYGIGGLFFAQSIAYNNKSFAAGKHPKSWTDVFDVKAFPGPRVLYPMDRDPAPLEIALLADGVDPKNLYPLDIDRGFKALERIREDVPKWAGRNVDVTGMLASGEAVVGQASTGRVASMKAQGAPLDYELNQALLYSDMWVVPKGAKNYADAMRFIQYISSAKAQAEFFAIYPNGPTNNGAFKYLTAEQAAKLPTSPEYFSKEIVVNAEWWAATDGSGKTNRDKVVERWNKWVFQK